MAKTKNVELWQIAKLQSAFNESKGTPDWTKYKLQMEWKNGSKWSFIGWTVPSYTKNITCYIKKNPTGEYLYIYNNKTEELERYLLNGAAKEVMELS